MFTVERWLEVWRGTADPCEEGTTNPALNNRVIPPDLAYSQ